MANLESVTLNNIPYSFSLTLINYSSKEAIQLPYKIIGELDLECDIGTPITTGSFLVSDIGSKILHRFENNNNCYIQLTLGIDYLDKTKNSTISHEFLVMAIDVVERTNNDVKYRISFTSKYWHHFNNYLKYSSGKEKTAVEILKDIFSKSGLSLNVSNFINNDKDKIFYITPTDAKFVDTMRYVLSATSNKDKFAYDIIYNNNDDKFYLFSLKYLLNDLILKGFDTKVFNDELTQRNVLFINSDSFLPPPTILKQSLAYNITEYTNNTSTINIEKLKPIKIHSFDHIKRKWNQTNISSQDMIDSLPATNIKSFSKIVILPKKDNKPNTVNVSAQNYQREYFSTVSGHYVDDNIRSLYYDTKVVGLQVTGDIARKVGDIISIKSDSAYGAYNRFEGVYVLIGVKSLVSFGGTFKQVLTICRADKRLDQGFTNE